MLAIVKSKREEEIRVAPTSLATAEHRERQKKNEEEI